MWILCYFRVRMKWSVKSEHMTGWWLKMLNSKLNSKQQSWKETNYLYKWRRYVQTPHYYCNDWIVFGIVIFQIYLFGSWNKSWRTLALISLMKLKIWSTITEKLCRGMFSMKNSSTSCPSSSESLSIFLPFNYSDLVFSCCGISVFISCCIFLLLTLKYGEWVWSLYGEHPY